MKTVGIHKVVPKINAGDVGSQAVYPLASNVLRIPPFGKRRRIRFLLYQLTSTEFSTDHFHQEMFQKKASCFFRSGSAS